MGIVSLHVSPNVAPVGRRDRTLACIQSMETATRRGWPGAVPVDPYGGMYSYTQRTGIAAPRAWPDASQNDLYGALKFPPGHY